MAVPTIAASTTGLAANAATPTVALPTYAAGDALIMLLGQSGTALPTWPANITATLLVSGAGRLTAWLLVPSDNTQTSFVATFSGNSQWHIGAYRGGEPSAIVGAAAAQVFDTNADLPAAPVAYPAGSTGNELVVSAAATSSAPGSSTWAAAGSNTIMRSTTGLQIMANADPMPAGVTTYTPASFNRGVEGTTRTENAITFVLPPAGTALTSASAGDFYALLLP